MTIPRYSITKVGYSMTPLRWNVTKIGLVVQGNPLTTVAGSRLYPRHSAANVTLGMASSRIVARYEVMP